MTQGYGRWALVPALMLVLGSTASAQEGKEEFKETYEAFAVAMGTSNPPVIPTGMTTTLQINVTRWTTDEEREALFAVLVEKGQEDLVKAIQKQEETGWIRVTGRAGARNPFPSERLRYALNGGDDYELLFTADPAQRPRLAALDAGVVLRRIGTVTEGGQVLIDGAPPGRDAGHGFDHFG